MRDLCLVVDTDVLVSRLLSPHPLAARAVDLAIGEGRLQVSEATLSELALGLARPEGRHISRCRHQRQASAIITGDADLLALDPFMEIRIVAAAIWVDRPF
ncbi:MAG: hypothetical protein IPL58_02825 [Betaproteobacteria bacterium]|uniref:PIN domain-containing protein n=1 Tax=Candidatus Proximibacter danicus TaxID=2954365 RepID=A0A9D7PQV9_9PROT|nr:hypothetical protein [Candidatus Proximibacter danicus]